MPEFRTPTALAVVTNKYGGEIVVTCDDGTVWIWGEKPPQTQKEADDRAFAKVAQRPYAATRAWQMVELAIPGSRAERLAPLLPNKEG